MARDRQWFESLFARVKNWGRWGDDDERGALNLLTAERTAEAARAVSTGRTVSCARDLATQAAPDNPRPVSHFMITAGDCRGDNPLPGFEQSTDFMGVACHGMAFTHVDALCHIFVDGVMYNGVAAEEVGSHGARRNSIMAAASGICGRGVLLDIPRVLGRDWLEPSHRVTVAELEQAEAAEGVEVGAGDVLLVSTGRTKWRLTDGPGIIAQGMAGLDAECIPWLRERDISVLGSDGVSDVVGGEMVTGWAMPVHQCVIAGMGVHLIDNIEIADLAGACVEEGRWSFLISVAPLRLIGGTGCVVNPIAVF
jgi:kynurenine formamidase